MYIHIPFCTHRCCYCDFNTYAGLQGLIPAYVDAVHKELGFISSSMSERLPIHTVYFGGGTPSLLSDNEFDFILNAVRNSFDLSMSAEITIEANPGTVSLSQFRYLRNLGVNRISLGMQSENAEELAMLERQHSHEDVIQAVEWARTAGFHNINLDLIYGLPRQTVEVWENSIRAAFSLHPMHLSLYALTIEQGTPMQRMVDQGKLPRPDDDLAADMYDVARELLADAGYVQYEISNWAMKDQAGEFFSCKHNLQYWRNLPYIGVGAGAHGFINHHRTVDVLSPAKYITKMKNGDTPREKLSFPNTPATIQTTFIDQNTEIGETMMMGLRLVDEGISRQVFQQRFGIELQDRFGSQINHLISVGLLEWVGEQKERLRLTPRGYILGNQVFVEFI